MPLYSYKCPRCGNLDDILKPLALLDRGEACYVCGTAMERQISAPRVVADYPGYQCPVSGKWIEGRAAHRENLAKHGCRVLETGETEQLRRRKEDDMAKLEERMAASAEEFVEKLSGREREQLGTELEHGAAVSYERKGA